MEGEGDIMSNSLSYSIDSYKLLVSIGGGDRIRTDDPLRAKQVLSQLSYTPIKCIEPLRYAL